MPDLLLSIFRFLRMLLSGHQALVIENVALRLQLAALLMQAHPAPSPLRVF